MRLLQRPQRLQIAPVAIDDLLGLPKTPFKVGILSGIHEHEGFPAHRTAPYMGENHHPVFRYVHVRLDGVSPDLHCPLEAGHGVLGMRGLVSSVPDALGLAILRERERG